MISRSLRIKFLASLGFAVLVLAVLAFYADAGKLVETVSRFNWALLPVILALTLFNYGVRFLKWHYYLEQIGVEGLGWWRSCVLFFSGLSMVVTPGKVGEWLKSYLLREMTGTPFFRSAPIILAERLTDGLAMVLLGAAGLTLSGLGWEVMAVIVLGGMAILMVIWLRPLATFFLDLAAKLPGMGSRAMHLAEFYEGARSILSPKNTVLGIVLGFFSWGAECVAYYLVLVGLGLPESPLMAVQAAFILAAASLGGSLLLTPGGLGVAEGGITGLAQYLVGASAELATASAILIRVSTLWFGVALGFIALAIATRMLGKQTAAPVDAAVTDGPGQV